MNTPVKLLLVLALCLAALCGLALIFVDPLVTAAVRAGAAHATGVPARLDSADLGLLSGRLELAGLELANPPGFRDEPFLRVGRASLDWQPRSLLAREVLVEELALDALVLNLERGAQGSNWGALLAHAGARGPSDREAEAPGAGQQRTLVVRRVVVTDVRVGLHLGLLPGGAASQRVEIARLELEGFRSDGSTRELIAALTRSLLEALLGATLESGAGLVPADVLDDLRGRLRDLGPGLRKVEGALEDAERALGGKLEGLLRGRR